MQPFTSSRLLLCPTPLPLFPCPRRFLVGFCVLRRSPSLASASSSVQPWASWLAANRNPLRHAFPFLDLNGSPRSDGVGGADIVQSVRGGDVLDEEEDEGELEEGEGSEFVEIGYISSVHGLRGEVRVKPSTDFPELRFLKPGRRWLRTRVSGKEKVREVELMEGRSHPGHKIWILSFNGVNSVDEETGRQIGTVVNVVNYGSNDLLRVMLNTIKGSFNGDSSSQSQESSSGPLVWIPFVQAIVPDVDIDNREMHITPPKGLLELNLCSDSRSKRERRQMEWKQRKKFQKRVASLKKKLAEMGQGHVLRGCSYGEENQRRLLSNQIGDINLRLFQLAMGNMNKCSEGSIYTEIFGTESFISMENGLQISQACYNGFSRKERNEDHYALRTKGHHLISECKLAIVLTVGSKETWEYVSSLSEEATSPVLKLKNVLSDYSRYAQVKEHHAPLPLIILSPAHEMQLVQELLSDHDYFGFDKDKVWLLKEEKLPVVSIVPNDQNRHKILLRSPWEIIQSPVGPGGIFCSVSSDRIVDSLNEMGIEYVQICSLSERCVLAHPLFLGLVSSHEVDVGIKIFTDLCKCNEVDMIFTMRYLSKVARQVDDIQFYAVPEVNKHVELVDNKWVDIEPSEPNSYRLYCPICSPLNSCPAGAISVMSIVD